MPPQKATNKKTALKEVDELMAREELAQAYRKCVETWTAHKSLRPDLWERAYNIALTSEDKDIKKSFIGNCKSLMKLHEPGGKELGYYLGTMYYSMERYGDAIRAYNNVLKEDLHTDIHQVVEDLLAMVYVAKKDYKTARKIVTAKLAHARRTCKAHSQYYGLMGQIERNIGDTETAASWYDKAIKYDPFETSWPRECALLLESKGQHARALKYWEKILSIPKDKANKVTADAGRPMLMLGEFAEDQAKARERLGHK